MELLIRELELNRDQKGSVLALMTAEELAHAKEILIIRIKPNETRGNHYHKVKGEWVGVIKGHAKFVYKDIETGEEKTILANEEEPKIIKTPINVAHAIKNVGTEELYIIEINSQTYDRDKPDSYKWKVLD